MYTILRVLEQHEKLACFELMYRMKFCRGNTTTNHNRRKNVRYLLLLSLLVKVEYDKTTKNGGLNAVQT